MTASPNKKRHRKYADATTLKNKYQCTVCGANYKRKFGVSVEMRIDDDLYYFRASVPMEDILDIKALEIQQWDRGRTAMEIYEPSLDWANEIPTSLLWAGKAWLITSVVSVIVLVLLARYTSWGRQFWRVTGGYFRGRNSIAVWAWLGVLLFSSLIAVRLNVLLSYYINDLYSSLQVAFEGNAAGNEAVRESGVRGFWAAIITFGLIAGLYVGRQILDIYLMQRFIIRWRVWLTDRLTSDWLGGDAFYRGRFLEEPVDNPDQRIQLDIDAFTTGTGQGTNAPTVGTASTLLFGAISVTTDCGVNLEPVTVTVVCPRLLPKAGLAPRTSKPGCRAISEKFCAVAAPSRPRITM